MGCSFCGIKIKKGERFVSVGDYPSWWKMAGARTAGPGYFGEVYHEACYLELLKKGDLREGKEKSDVVSEKSPQSKEEQPSNQSARRRLVR